MNMYLRMLLMFFRARRGSKLGVWDTAVTNFRTNLADLDIFRHMNNGKYLTIMDLARYDLMVRSGLWQKFQQRGWYPVVAGQTISYRRSLTLGQKFQVHTRILGMDERWAYLEQRFQVGDVLYAQAVVRARFLRRSGGSVPANELSAIIPDPQKPQPLPAWITQWTQDTNPPTDA